MRVLIADDQILFAESLRLMLENYSDVETVAIANSGQQVMEMIKEVSVDIVIMDIGMPVMDGLCCADMIKRQSERIKIVMLTSFENEEYMFKAIKIDVDGFILKSIKPQELIVTLRAIDQGLKVFHPQVLKCFTSYAIQKERETIHTQKIENELSLDKQEKIILRYMVDGLSNREIAAFMNYSEGTIKNKISVILDKMSLKDRIQAVVFAIKHQLV